MTDSPPLIHWRVEVPRGAFRKRDAQGKLDLISPLPCPFNYGSVPGLTSPDGDEVDVLILGPRLPRGATGHSPLRGRVHFVDQGLPDDKWVCADRPLRPADRALITAFFAAYGFGKALAAALRGRPGPSGLRGVDWSPAQSPAVGPKASAV